MIALRKASAGDAVALQLLYSRALARATWLPAAARVDPDFAGDARNESVHVAVNDKNDLCGLISLQPEDRFVHHLYVCPKKQRRGVGGVLLSILADYSDAPWQLKCVRSNLIALAFYRSHHWREVAVGTSADGTYLLLQSPASASSEQGPIA